MKKNGNQKLRKKIIWKTKFLIVNMPSNHMLKKKREKRGNYYPNHGEWQNHLISCTVIRDLLYNTSNWNFGITFVRTPSKQGYDIVKILCSSPCIVWNSNWVSTMYLYPKKKKKKRIILPRTLNLFKDKMYLHSFEKTNGCVYYRTRLGLPEQYHKL